MKVEKLMVTKVLTCRPEDDLRIPARAMWDGDCGSVPVVDGWSRVMGIITDRDICMASYTKGRKLEDIPTADVMTRTVYCCHPGDDLKHAEDLMRQKRVRRLPVVDVDGHLVGLLSLNDIARAGKSGTLRSREAGLQQAGLVLADVSEPRLRPEAACELDPSLRKLSSKLVEIC